MKTLEKFLKEQNASSDLYEFAKDLTLKEFWDTSPRGDWMYWLFVKIQKNKHKDLKHDDACYASYYEHAVAPFIKSGCSYKDILRADIVRKCIPFKDLEI